MKILKRWVLFGILFVHAIGAKESEVGNGLVQSMVGGWYHANSDNDSRLGTFLRVIEDGSWSQIHDTGGLKITGDGSWGMSEKEVWIKGNFNGVRLKVDDEKDELVIEDKYGWKQRFQRFEGAPLPLIALPDVPKSVAEAVVCFRGYLNNEDFRDIACTLKSDLIQLHMSYGMAIRNRFGLWLNNDALLKSCGSTSMDPDEASGIILTALWRSVRDEQPDANALDTLEMEISNLRIVPFPVRNLTVSEFFSFLSEACINALADYKSSLTEVIFKTENKEETDRGIDKSGVLNSFPMLKHWGRLREETFPKINPLEILGSFFDVRLSPPNTIIFGLEEYFYKLEPSSEHYYEEVQWEGDSFDLKILLYHEKQYGNQPKGIHRFGEWYMTGETLPMTISKMVEIYEKAPGAEHSDELHEIRLYNKWNNSPGDWGISIFSFRQPTEKAKTISLKDTGYLSLFSGEEMETFLSADKLDYNHEWVDSKSDPPISPIEARNTLLRYIRDELKLEMVLGGEMISLKRYYPTNYWYYDIHFYGTPDGQIKGIHGFLLLDGTVIPFSEKDTSGTITIGLD